jgi:hypothetical protein
MRPDRLAVRLLAVLQTRLAGPARAGRERGDIPGWVMVTVMSAGLIVAIFSVFRDAITEAIRTALNQVVSQTGR